ncbi:MAG: carbohydrate ABC transporter permease [Candidatus Auribacterota bacterium]
MKDRSGPIVKWLLFILILPPLFSVLLPFYMIIRIAIMPEGLTASENGAMVIWTEHDPISQYQWRSKNGMIHQAGDTSLINVTWQGIDTENPVTLSYPFHQNLDNFTSLEIIYKSNAPSFTMGFSDRQGKTTSSTIKNDQQGDWVTSRIALKSIDFSRINLQNLNSVVITIDQPAGGTIQIKKIKCLYKSITLANFKNVMLSASFGRYLLNSVFVSLLIMLGNIILSTMAGFAFAWRSFPLRKTLYISMIAMIMIPMQVLMIPTFILIQELEWLNTYKALIIPSLIYPINIFLMRQYISKIPTAFAEVALVDGASYFTIFFRIILPICKPAIAIVGINTFVNSWNSFLYPFILTNTAEMRTLPVGLALYIGLFDVDWANLMSASSLSAIPVILVFLFFQKQIIAGMLSGTTHNL